MVLDGGMSRELMRLGAPFRQPEWSALSLIESPAHVRQAHVEFTRAGARVLTTNAYAVVPFHLGEERFERDGHRLAALAGELARSAADEFDGVLVAGCLPPPLGSYRHDLFADGTARSILDVLVDAQSPFVDVWLAETLSSSVEARTAANAVRDAGSAAPLWVAYTVDDVDGTTLRSGESVADAVVASEQLGAAAVAFNCSQPEALEHAVAAAAQVTDLPIGVYANVLDGHTDEGANEYLSEARLDVTLDSYATWAARCVEAGATMVGGCCGTTSDHIAAISAHLPR